MVEAGAAVLVPEVGTDRAPVLARDVWVAMDAVWVPRPRGRPPMPAEVFDAAKRDYWAGATLASVCRKYRLSATARGRLRNEERES